MMRRFYFLTVFLLSIINTVAAQLKSEVNKCFELTSIVFRLAGAPEYVNNDILGYANDIDSCFKKYDNHKLIHYVKSLREEYEVGYDAITNAAACLEIRKGKVCVRSKINLSKMHEIDNRWTEQNFIHFVTLLNDFYKTTKFKSFYMQHADLYNVAVERMNERLKDVNLGWFANFFGKEIEKPLVIVSLVNGPHNYAFTESEKQGCGIVIGSAGDAEGLPYYNKNQVSIIVHELLHGYTNSQIADCWNLIDSAAHKIYPLVKEDMSRLAYENAQSMMTEWLTNLYSIVYVQENPIPGSSVNLLLRLHQNNGFIWMERSVSFMSYFFENRDRFTSIYDYIPQLIGFIHYTADNFSQISNEYTNRQPYIVDAFPVPGSSVAFDVDTIQIRFSEPMLDAHGMNPVNDKKIMAIPMSGMPFWKNEHTLLIPLDKSKLEKGKSYGANLYHKAFQSRRTYSMRNDYIYTFNVCGE